MAKFNKEGHQIPDDTPIEVNLNLNRPLTQEEKIAQAVAAEVSRVAEHKELETFDESHDFNVDDDDFEDNISQAEECALMIDEHPKTYEEFEQEHYHEQAQPKEKETEDKKAEPDQRESTDTSQETPAA